MGGPNMAMTRRWLPLLHATLALVTAAMASCHSDGGPTTRGPVPEDLVVIGGPEEVREPVRLYYLLPHLWFPTLTGHLVPEISLTRIGTCDDAGAIQAIAEL